jgi:hypothetical protein
MSYRDYDAIQESTDIRFPGTSFAVSCFDSVEEISTKPVDYFSKTIIIMYHYRSEYYQNLDISLQDADYVTVQRQKGESYIRFCDVIDALRAYEIAGLIKPNDGYYLEDIQRVEHDRNRIPMYRILWGT